MWRDVFFARSEQIVFNNFVGRPKNLKFWKRRGCSMSKMTLNSKEQKIFSNMIQPIVSGLHFWSISKISWSQCGETCFSLGQNRSCSTILWVGLRISNFGRGGGVACRKWLWVLKSKKYSVTRYGLLSAAPIFFLKMWVTKWGWYSSFDDKDFFLESIKIENRSFLSYLSRRFVNS